MVEIVVIVHPPDRRLELFFSGRNNDRAPARQTTRIFFSSIVLRTNQCGMTTRTFFSGRNNDRAPARQTTRTFIFSSRNNDRAPARQTTILFFFWS